MEDTEYITWGIGSLFIKYKQGRGYLVKRAGKERMDQRIDREANRKGRM